MDMAVTLLRFAAFLFSAAGYVALARAYWKIPARASYIFVFSAQACVVYFGGLAGILPYTAATVFFGGIAAFIVLLLKKKLRFAFNRSSLSALNLAFIAGSVAVIASLINTRLVHYDNFSHWALVVKDMLVTDGFPTALSAIIDFKSYPLGSSSFLYYFARVVGTSEGVLLVGQALLLLACFYAVFGVIRDTKRFLLVALLGIGCSALAYFNISIRINNLLVDFLLPALTLAAVAVIAAEQKDFLRACVTAVPILSLLVIVKNTGIFFAALCYVFLLARAARFAREIPGKRYTGIAFAAIGVSLIALILWNVHTAFAFAGEASKFSYDFQSVLSFSIDKTPAQIRSIVTLFFQTVFSLDSLASRGILLFNGLALGAYFAVRFVLRKKWELLKTLLVLDAAIAVYYAGILGMYIVAMPLDEALRLAGFDRYASSMVLFFIGVLSMRAVNDVENSFYYQQGEKRDYRAFKSLTTKNLYQGATVAFTLIAAMMLLSELNGMNAAKADYNETLPAEVQAMVGDRWEAEDDETRYLFYATDADDQVSNYYLPYVGRYFLFASQVDAVSGFDEETFMGQIQTYDRFIILESTPAIRAYMRAHAGLAGDPGVYDVLETFPEAVSP